TRQLPDAGLAPVEEPAPMVAAVDPRPLPEPGAVAPASTNTDVPAALAAANDPVPQPDATAAVAAMAVAAVETPRRTAQRRAARTQSPTAAERRAPMLAAVEDTPPAITLANEDIAPAIAFPM